MTTPQLPPTSIRSYRNDLPLYHPDLRENHRLLAGRLGDLAEFVSAAAQAPHTGIEDRAYLSGYSTALLDLSQHLSAGDFLPGGQLNGAELTA